MPKLFTVRDTKSDSYGMPFCSQATGAAMRGFADEVNNDREGNVLAKHPEDFILFELGSFDERTGEITLHDAKKSLACGIDLVRKELKAV